MEVKPSSVWAIEIGSFACLAWGGESVVKRISPNMQMSVDRPSFERNMNHSVESIITIWGRKNNQKVDDLRGCVWAVVFSLNLEFV